MNRVNRVSGMSLESEILTLHIEELDLGNIASPVLIGVKERTQLICLSKTLKQNDFTSVQDHNGLIYLTAQDEVGNVVVMAPTKIMGTLEIWSAVVPDIRSVFNREITGSCISFVPKKYSHHQSQEF